MKRDKITIFIISFLIPLVICYMLKMYFTKCNYNLNEFDGIDISNTLLGLWGTLLGFIITATSILITMDGKEYIHAVKGSKHYSTVVLTYGFACFDLLAATIFGIIVICINTWNILLSYLLFYFILSTLLLLFFCILFLFFMIIKSIQ